MPDALSPADRALVDAALAEGRVTRCAPGKSAWANMRHLPTGRVVWVNTLELARDGKVRAGLKGAWLKAEDLEPIVIGAAPRPQPSAREARLDLRRRRIRALHAEGRLPGDIGAALGISAAQVRAELGKMGLQPNTSGVREQRAAEKAARRDAIAAMWRANPHITGTRLAELLGVTPSTINQDLREMHAAGVLQ